MKKRILIFIYFFLNPIIKILLYLRKTPIRQKPYNFVICSIFKNEAKYLVEWLEFHRLIGVDHIFLYNNFSEDNYLNVLQKYITEGFVSLKEWPYEKGQISAYEDCYKRVKSQSKWIMFLDLDEFICLKYETNIKDWVLKYERYPSVILYWLMFGTSGKIEDDSQKIVIEQYTHCWDSIRNVGKIILNTDFEPVNIYHHHIFCKFRFMGLNLKIPMINEQKKFIYFPGTEKCQKNFSIQINHYWSKSLYEYIRKIDKGDVFSIKHEELRKNLDFFYWHEYKNVSNNFIIWRFLIDLKISLKEIDLKFK